MKLVNKLANHSVLMDEYDMNDLFKDKDNDFDTHIQKFKQEISILNKSIDGYRIKSDAHKFVELFFINIF